MSDISVLTKGYWKIPYSAAADPKLPLDAKGMLAYFCSFCSSEKNYCYPSRQTIMDDLNISKPTYLGCMRSLESLGYIVKGSYGKTNKITIADRSQGAVPEKYGIVPKAVMTDPDVSVKAKGVYSILSALSSHYGETSRSGLCEMSGVTKNSLTKYIHELIAAGYISRNAQSRKNGEFSSASYCLEGISSTAPCTGKLTGSVSPCTNNLTSLPLPCTNVFTPSDIPGTNSFTPPRTNILTMPRTGFLTPNKEKPTNVSLTASLSSNSVSDEDNIRTLQTEEAKENYDPVFEKRISGFLAETDNISSSVDISKDGSLYMLYVKQLRSLIGEELKTRSGESGISYLVSICPDMRKAAENIWTKSRDKFYERAASTTIKNIPAYLRAIIATAIDSECVEFEMKCNTADPVIRIDLSLPDTVARA